MSESPQRTKRFGRGSSSAVSRIRRPGSVDNHGATLSTSLASRTMAPQSAVGGCTPRPRKLSPDDSTIIIPTNVVL